VVGVDRRSAGLAILDGHGQRVGGQRRLGARVDGPADNAAAEHVEHDCAVDLSLSGWVLGYVGDPQLVGAVAAEPAIDEVTGGGQVRDLVVPGPARQTGKAVSAHDQLNGAASHHQAAPVNKLGVDAPRPVGAAGLLVHLPDDLQQHRVAHRTR